MRGLVIKNTGSWYVVRTDDGQLFDCKVKGNFRLRGIRSTNPVAVGDRVSIVQQPTANSQQPMAFITDIEDRRNYIIRKASNLSKQSHIIAANVDQAALIVTVSTIIIGAFCSLSLGAVDCLGFLGKTLFDWFDFITGQIFLPIVGFLTCIFIGWFLPHKVVRDEFTNWGTLRGRFFHFYLFLVKYICPLAILFIFLHQLGLL